MSEDLEIMPNGGHRLRALTLVPHAAGLATKDFKSDQEVRWCPGCGDYAILAAFQAFLPELEVPRENVVVVSGIGCSSSAGARPTARSAPRFAAPGRPAMTSRRRTCGT